MSEKADIIIIGGGVAGLSVAAELSPFAQVTVLEAESALGVHASGRSATLSHFGIGTPTVRVLTNYSRAFFQTPPTDFCDSPLSQITNALFVARNKDIAALEALEKIMSPFAPISKASLNKMEAACPMLQLGEGGIVAGLFDPTAMRIDIDLLLQGYHKKIKRNGAAVVFNACARSIVRDHDQWCVETKDNAYRAPILVNAAGAWGEELAALAGVKPLGLSPLRRTIIVVDPPQEYDVHDWPFVRTAVEEFALLPQSGQLLATPLDQNLSQPCDAQPEEHDIALAALRVEEYTQLKVKRIAHRWAGLRTFSKDKNPIAGFAEDAPGFFWLAGQGGYGIQTAPAMAEISAALILGKAWPEELMKIGVSPDALSPKRFFPD